MTKKANLPYWKFFPGDWFKCPEVRALPKDVRMDWFEILLLMHESTERGYLTLNGKPMPDDVLSGLLRCGEGVNRPIKEVLNLLEQYNVFSRRKDGAIYSRRMVHDEAKRVADIDNGNKGGNPQLIKNKRNRRLNPPVKPTVNMNMTSDNDNSIPLINSIKQPPIPDERKNKFLGLFYDVCSSAGRPEPLCEPKDYIALSRFLNTHKTVDAERWGKALANGIKDTFHANNFVLSYICPNFTKLENFKEKKEKWL
jgi:hypothetical protein